MNEWFDDFKTAVAFLTRLPMPHPDGAIPTNFVHSRAYARNMFCVAMYRHHDILHFVELLPHTAGGPKWIR